MVNSELQIALATCWSFLFLGVAFSERWSRWPWLVQDRWRLRFWSWTSSGCCRLIFVENLTREKVRIQIDFPWDYTRIETVCGVILMLDCSWPSYLFRLVNHGHFGSLLIKDLLQLLYLLLQLLDFFFCVEILTFEILVIRLFFSQINGHLLELHFNFTFIQFIFELLLFEFFLKQLLAKSYILQFHIKLWHINFQIRNGFFIFIHDLRFILWCLIFLSYLLRLLF